MSESFVGALLASGLAAGGRSRLRLQGAILATGPTLVFVRRDGDRADRVYLGLDSLLLREAVALLASPGDRAIELGTGSGLVAVALVDSYRTVVATDIVDGVAATALLTGYLNPRPSRHRLVVGVADVGTGLRPGSFDFVAANTPWVPAGAAGGLRCADGGPTGMELPTRFVSEGSELLRPSGVAVFLMNDVTFEDGSSPLSALCAGLDERGYLITVVPTPYVATVGTIEWLTAEIPAAVTARHVAVIVARPPPPCGLASAVARLEAIWSEGTGATSASVGD